MTPDGSTVDFITVGMLLPIFTALHLRRQ